MIIKSANFLMSNTRFDFLPDGNIPEYAFIGRSNVGKSSLINMLVQRNGLAKTSSVPGKTVAINHFIVNNAWYLVDLPGYGYAQHSKKTREQWRVMINNYIMRRRNLVCTFVLVDARIEPQNNDLGFMGWLGDSQMPFCIVFTKADKVSRNELEKNVEAYKKRLLEDWEELPPIFITSSETGQGRDDILDYIEAQNAEMANLMNKQGLSK
jgi:GTP-binding protein